MELGSLLAGCRNFANPPAGLENKQEAKTLAGFGRTLSVLSRSRGPVGSLARTLLALETWQSSESTFKWTLKGVPLVISETWCIVLDQENSRKLWRLSKRSHTKSRYFLYRLVPSIRRRTGKDTGLSPDLWGIPQASMPGQGDPNDPKRGKKPDWQLKAALWPTAKVKTGDYQYSQGDKNRPVLNLSGAMKAALWPTANVHDSRPPTSADVRQKIKNRSGAGCSNLNETLGKILNGSSAPTKMDTPFAAFQLVFTSWLMGYSLEYLAKFGLKSSEHSETQSSPKSRRKSSKP